MSQIVIRPSPIGLGSPWHDVEAYGAVGNGIADDTAAIQAALDAAIGGPSVGSYPFPVRFAVGSVYLPRRSYRITAPLKVYSVYGLSVIADRETIINVDGALPCAWDLNGVAVSRFQGITVRGHTAAATVTNAWQLDWAGSATYSRSTSNVTFENCSVRDLKYVNGFGIGVNSSNLDVSNIYLDKCSVYGQSTTDATWWQAGMRLGSGVGGNILGHFVNGVLLTFNKYHIYADAVNVVIISPQFTHSEVDLYARGAAAIRMIGGRSETALRLYEEPGGATYKKNVSISDFLWLGDTIAADSQVIRKLYSGSLILDNVHISDPTVPIIQAGHSSKPTQIHTRGLSSQTAVASVVVKASTGAVNVTHGNYQQMANSLEISSATPHYAVTL